MVDTIRTIAALQTLLADNTSADISAQDLRDMMVSLAKVPFGRYSTLVAAPTAITVAGTYYKVSGTTVASGMEEQFAMSADNRLTYIGDQDVHVHVASSISMTAAGNNKVVCFKLAKNGTPQDSSLVKRKISTGTDIGSTALHGDCHMTNGDYLELYGTNETDTTEITVEEVYLFVLGMKMF